MYRSGFFAPAQPPKAGLAPCRTMPMQMSEGARPQHCAQQMLIHLVGTYQPSPAAASLRDKRQMR